ncbi:hypothetical protein EB1_02480 [Empedobacter brevis NBRC 14943 = ATCC 43319]|uniref:Sugar-binding protein n=1 Tax=Empedobacter brevis NBRC 14943 = ATCC 43319 TaxID=1218108 RepID=A0A511ND96_9FLAO|nr:hypothetical protein [Empedobacter brevis]GEM50458.1 hypothetical protein EB1_02480 [Empedobacter brevis NBRC 14943 = ATCC 43319]
MLKKITLIPLLISGFAFAQKSELEQNDIIGHPNYIEESMQKARIRVMHIEGYDLEYYTKSTYNKDGNPVKRDYFDEAGNTTFSESFHYNESNKLISRELKNEDGSLVFIFDYEYTTDGYIVIKSENDVNVLKTAYKLDTHQNVTYERETNLLEDTDVFIEKNYQYQNGFLIKTLVKYNQGSYTLDYKNDAKGNPLEEVYTSKDNKQVNKYLRKFDDNNNIIEETTLDETGKIKNVSTIKYQYDEHKNWTKRTQYVKHFDQPISNTTRTIRY